MYQWTSFLILNPRIRQTYSPRYGHYGATSGICVGEPGSEKLNCIKGKNRIYVPCGKASCQKMGKVLSYLLLVSPFKLIIRLSHHFRRNEGLERVLGSNASGSFSICKETSSALTLKPLLCNSSYDNN